MRSYRCGRCGITSRAYLTAAGARAHGYDHRHEVHGGDHPDGECLVPGRPVMPQTAVQWRAIMAVVLLLAVSYACRHLTG